MTNSGTGYQSVFRHTEAGARQHRAPAILALITVRFHWLACIRASLRPFCTSGLSGMASASCW